MTWVRSQASPSGICSARSGIGMVLPPSTSVFPVDNHPPMLHIHISFIHGRSWAGEGDAATSGGRVQGGGKMSIKDNILSKKK